MKFEKWMRGYYRLSSEAQFAGIRHQRDGWHIEIRDSATGTLQRYAGIWRTLRDARAEAEHALNPTPLIEIFGDIAAQRRIAAIKATLPDDDFVGYRH